MSRLRLVNVFFGSYLELMLSAVGGVFPLGNNEISKIAWMANENTRSKLDQYKISVLGTEAASLPYTIYLVVFTTRLYKYKLSRYVTRQDKLSTSDMILNKLAEQGRIMSLAMYGMDAFFYSIRTLSHATGSTADRYSLNRLMGLAVSAVVVVLVVADLLLLIIDNKDTLFASLRLKYRLDIRDQAKMESLNAPQ